MSRDLQATFRAGRLLAAYLYLRRDAKATVEQSKRISHGMVIDYDAAGVAVGIEFVAPSQLNLDVINQVLRSIGQPDATSKEVWPLIANAQEATAA